MNSPLNSAKKSGQIFIMSPLVLMLVVGGYFACDTPGCLRCGASGSCEVMPGDLGQKPKCDPGSGVNREGKCEAIGYDCLASLVKSCEVCEQGFEEFPASGSLLRAEDWVEMARGGAVVLSTNCVASLRRSTPEDPACRYTGSLEKKGKNFCEPLEFPEDKVANCLHYSSEGECIRCEKTHFIFAGECLKLLDESVDEFCEVYWARGKIGNQVCKYCPQGYFPTMVWEAIWCLPLNPEHCLISTDQGCLRCRKGFKPFRFYCVPDPDFSDEVRAEVTAQPPLLCEEGQENRDDCRECPEGEILNQNLTAVPLGCQPFPKNCKFSRWAFACDVCIEGFQLNSFGVCEPITQVIEGCLEYSLLFGCEICKKGFALVKAKLPNCQHIVETPQTNIIGCGRYKDPNTCQYCSLGFAMSEYGCLPGSMPHCFAADFRSRCLVNNRALESRDCLIPTLDGNACEVCRPGFQQKSYRGPCEERFTSSNAVPETK